MVRKLFKHEVFALMRTLCWFMLATILLGGIARLAFEFIPKIAVGEDPSAFEMGGMFALGFVLLAWFGTVEAMAVIAVILCVVRYFKSLFTGEGYLTFSLPVTPTQLLVAKFLAALVTTLACLLSVALSVLIALPLNAQSWAYIGEVLAEFFGSIGILFREDTLFGIELIFFIIAIIPCGILYCFLLASIGQLFTKGRVGITILLFYGVSFVLNILFMVLVFPLLAMWEEQYLLLFALLDVLLIAFDIAAFFVTRYLLIRKVNLVV